MRLNPWRDRASAIARMRGKLEREHYPRLQMGLIVALTGFAGLAASFLMLQAGLTSMALRYCYAMGVAYIAFIVLLWIWLRWNGDGLDLPSGDGGGDPVSACGGKGGTFDGGGASGDYQPASQAFDAGGGGGGGSDGFGVDVDVGDAAIPLAVVALIIGVALSSLFVIYTAPVLFAELLVDGLLSASLYRRLRGVDRRHWLESALRRTWVPFLLTTAFVAAAGWGMGRYAPEAHSIGDVLRHRAQVAAPR